MCLGIASFVSTYFEKTAELILFFSNLKNTDGDSYYLFESFGI